MKVCPPDTELISYCGASLNCVGYVWVRVESQGEEAPVKLYIVRSDRRPLLGREWLRTVKLNWSGIMGEQLTCNQVHSKIQKPTEVIEMLKRKFPVVFSPTMGKITNLQARLYLKPNAVPKFGRARRVAFPMYEVVEKETDRQVEEGLLVKVEKSEWATPLVVIPKKQYGVRICGDYKATLNPALVVDQHPLPTIDELFSKMAGGNKFSKIDLSSAYLQLEVHPDDRHLMTLNTHKGLYQPTRLMFGIASAPAKWQRLMEQLVGDIPGVSVFLDDIKITASSDEEHLVRLEAVFRRLRDHNMRVNLQKCEFLKDQIEYCGYVIDKHGIHRVKSKVEAITRIKKPTYKEEVRAFLGLINYYGRFVKNLSNIVYPLNKLLQN